MHVFSKIARCLMLIEPSWKPLSTLHVCNFSFLRESRQSDIGHLGASGAEGRIRGTLTGRLDFQSLVDCNPCWVNPAIAQHDTSRDAWRNIARLVSIIEHENMVARLPKSQSFGQRMDTKTGVS